jgi:hypothetical protein
MFVGSRVCFNSRHLRHCLRPLTTKTRLPLNEIPPLDQFIRGIRNLLTFDNTESSQTKDTEEQEELSPNVIPYLRYPTQEEGSRPLAVWIESYGCQMNFSDTEIGA